LRAVGPFESTVVLANGSQPRAIRRVRYSRAVGKLASSLVVASRKPRTICCGASPF
jgi:hypothetical protein